jgi:hypothetical protein
MDFTIVTTQDCCHGGHSQESGEGEGQTRIVSTPLPLIGDETSVQELPYSTVRQAIPG